MEDLAEVWKFTRFRLAQAIDGLSDEQMRWRAYEGGHCIFEYLYHIAGAEHYWYARMTGRDPAGTELEARLDRAIIYDFLQPGDFPFGEPDFNRSDAEAALALTYERMAPIYEEPLPDQLRMPIVSPVGDSVTGREGLIRLAQHAGYHTGQIWVLRQDPRFP